MYDNETIQTNDDNRSGENGVRLNGFNGFLDADAIILLKAVNHSAKASGLQWLKLNYSF